MSRPVFRFETVRLHAAFAPRKPRHPLLRLALGLLGLGLLALLVVFGVFVGAAMLAAGLLLRLWKQRGKPIARDRNVVDGQYRMVDKPRLDSRLLAR
jgi:hypothetical protein